MTTIEMKLQRGVALADVDVSNHGTIFLFEPLTDTAQEWIEANIAGETQWFGNALAVEHRFAADLAAGMAKDGLRLE